MHYVAKSIIVLVNTSLDYNGLPLLIKFPITNIIKVENKYLLLHPSQLTIHWILSLSKKCGIQETLNLLTGCR